MAVDLTFVRILIWTFLIAFFLLALLNLLTRNWLDWVPFPERLKILPYPAILLTLGIIGTFAGIYLGLKGFDPTTTAKFNSSIKTLIRGLTISFETSIAGMSGAIIYRVSEILFSGDTRRGVGAPEIVQAIDGMSEKLDTFINDLEEKVVDGLTAALQNLVTNLEKIIADKLGESFRQLNESITKLNVWVIEYKSQIATLMQAYKETLAGIEKIREEAQNISDAMEPMPEYMADIKEIIEGVNQPIKDFADLVKKAEDAFPIMKEDLKKLTDEFNQSVDSINEAQKKTSESAEKLADSAGKLVDEVKQATNKHLSEFSETLASLSEKFAEDYEPITAGLQSMLSAMDTK